jgi:tetratricopeptide (TPR) repeat protein
VFAGGWTMAAAEAVCAGDGIEEWEILDLLDGLVGKSLVQAEEADGSEARHRMLETVRQYAWERLEESGASAAVRGRHLDWCVALALEAEPALAGPEQQAWARRLEAEHDNLRAALTWSIQEEHRPAAGLQLASALWRFWGMHGHLGEGRRWLEQALARAGDAPALSRARALLGAGNLAHRHGDLEQAGMLYRQNLALRRELGDRHGIAGALNGLGLVAWSLGDYVQAAPLFEECLALCRELGDSQGVAIALANLGCVVRSQGECRRAQLLYEEALALQRTLGDIGSIALAMSNLGVVAERRGDYERAAILHRESLALFRELGDTTGIAMALGNLGKPIYLQGDAVQAKALLEESLALFRDMDDHQGLSMVKADLGNLA